MTIREVLATVDRLKPNTYTTEDKIDWLSELDGKIFIEVFAQHEDSPAESFSGYEVSDQDAQLLVPEPYAYDIYIKKLEARIDEENNEIVKYNQEISLYNEAFKQFQDFWRRTHAFIPAASRFRF